MEETIDFFKYMSLLAKLESIKGTKKPIHDFVNEIYRLSNKLQVHNEKYQPHPQTARYSYMLVTRAITYNGSVKPIKNLILRQLEVLTNSLLNKEIVTKENVVETYEFCTETIDISPSSLKQFFILDDIIQPLTNKKFYLSFWGTKELKLFSDSQQAARVFLKEHNPDSILLDYITFDQKEHDKVIAEMQEFNNLYTPILKDLK